MRESAQPRRFLALDFGLPLGLFLAVIAVFAVDFVIGGAGGQTLDVVFMFDEAAGLSEFAGDMKTNWLTIANSLNTQGHDCRFAVIPCQPNSTQIPTIPWTAKTADLERKLTGTMSDSGQPYDPWPDTDFLQAVEDALKLDFRNDAVPMLFLTTNSIVEDEDRLLRLAQQCSDGGIKAIIQANPKDQDRFLPLYKHGGRFYSLTGENRTVETEIETQDESVNFGSLIASVGDGGGDDLADVKLLVGVKVRGKIALVCDISGSMA